MVGVSVLRAQAMKLAGVPIPLPVQINLLIDTGASATCIDPEVLASLCLTPTGSVPIHTPSTNGAPHVCNQYDVCLYLLPANGLAHFVDALPIIESSLRSQGIDGLLGRDVLAQCALFYNGPQSGYTLSY
jgi:hypothetical protein